MPVHVSPKAVPSVTTPRQTEPYHLGKQGPIYSGRLIVVEPDSPVWKAAAVLTALRPEAVRQYQALAEEVGRDLEEKIRERRELILRTAAQQGVSGAHFSELLAKVRTWADGERAKAEQKLADAAREAAARMKGAIDRRALAEMGSWGDGATVWARRQEDVPRLRRVVEFYNKLVRQGLWDNYRRVVLGGPKQAAQAVRDWADEAMSPAAKARARAAAEQGTPRRFTPKPEVAAGTLEEREHARKLLTELTAKVAAAEREAARASSDPLFAPYTPAEQRSAQRLERLRAKTAEVKARWAEVVRLEDLLVEAHRAYESLRATTPPRRGEALKNLEALERVGYRVSNLADTTFKSGKYANVPLSRVPVDYLYHVAYGDAPVRETVQHVAGLGPVVRRVVEAAEWGQIQALVREYLNSAEGERRLDEAFGSSFRGRGGERSKIPDLSGDEGDKPPPLGQAPEMEQRSAQMAGLAPRRPSPLTPEEEKEHEHLAGREADPKDPFWETPVAFRESGGMGREARDLERALDRSAAARRERELYFGGQLARLLEFAKDPGSPLSRAERQRIFRRFHRARRRYGPEYLAGQDFPEGEQGQLEQEAFYSMSASALGRHGPGAMRAYRLAIKLSERLNESRSREELLEVMNEVMRQFDPANMGSALEGEGPAPFIQWLHNRFAERWNAPDLAAENLGLRGRKSKEEDEEAAPRRRLSGKGGRGAAHGTDAEIAYLGGESDLSGGEGLARNKPFPEEDVLPGDGPGGRRYDVSQPNPDEATPPRKRKPYGGNLSTSEGGASFGYD